MLPALTKLSCFRLEGGTRMFSGTESSSTWGHSDEGGASDMEIWNNLDNPSHNLHWSLRLRPRSSAVTHLQFDNSDVDSDILGIVIALPRRPESFRYSIGDEDVGDTLLRLSHFYKGLCSQRNSLTELFITSDNWWRLYTEDGVLGSLSSFIVLQHLKLPATALLPCHNEDLPITPSSHNPLDSLLPPSLVTLEVDIRDNNWTDEFVAKTGLPDTLRETSRALPELRFFKLIGVGDMDGEFGNLPRALGIWPNAESWSAGHRIILSLEQ